MRNIFSDQSESSLSRWCGRRIGLLLIAIIDKKEQIHRVSKALPIAVTIKAKEPINHFRFIF